MPKVNKNIITLANKYKYIEQIFCHQKGKWPMLYVFDCYLSVMVR